MFKPFRSTLAAAGLAALSAVAQEKSTVTTNRLSEVVVTATRTEEPVSQVAASVSIINRATIEEKKFHTLAEALESVPGLVVARNGTPGQATSVFLRGTESNHTLLTVDGRRVPSMLAGGYDWGNITLDNIERIEVVRSANSALYGGDAIGGVVNLITRTGRGLKSPEHGVSFEGGSFNSFRETAHSRGAVGRFDYAFAISQFNAQFPRVNNDYRHTGLRGAIGWEATKSVYADFKVGYSLSDGGSPGSISYPSAVDHLKRETIHVSPGITWAPSDSWETKLFYTFENQLQPSQDSGSNNRLNVAAHVVDWQNILKATDTWKLSAGMLWQDQMVDRNRGGSSGDINANLQTLGGFLQSQWSPSSGFTLINAVRHDAYSDYQSATTWRQAASYRIPQSDTLLFANIARSVAPPTAQDLYYPGGYSNPNLKSERALSWEFGAEQSLSSSQLSLSATWFQHKYRDFIQVDGGYVPQNIAKATSEGIELGLKWKPAGCFNAAASYTYLTAENDTANLRLLRRPRHQLGLDAVIRPMEKLTLSTGASWVVERQDSSGPQVPIGDYLLVRAAASYQINKYSQIWIRGDNLLDQKYDALRNYPALRLGLYGGLAFMF